MEHRHTSDSIGPNKVHLIHDCGRYENAGEEVKVEMLFVTRLCFCTKGELVLWNLVIEPHLQSRSVTWRVHVGILLTLTLN